RETVRQAATVIGNVRQMSRTASLKMRRASGLQHPQQVEQPVQACRSAKVRTPSSAAWRISLSVTDWHTQTYMATTSVVAIQTQMRMIVNMTSIRRDARCGPRVHAGAGVRRAPGRCLPPSARTDAARARTHAV